MVGLKRRDLFVDGGFAVTRHVFRQFSAGSGCGAGLSRGSTGFDSGPRLTMRVRRNIKVTSIGVSALPVTRGPAPDLR